MLFNIASIAFGLFLLLCTLYEADSKSFSWRAVRVLRSQGYERTVGNAILTTGAILVIAGIVGIILHFRS